MTHHLLKVTRQRRQFPRPTAVALVRSRIGSFVESGADPRSEVRGDQLLHPALEQLAEPIVGVAVVEAPEQVVEAGIGTHAVSWTNETLTIGEIPQSLAFVRRHLRTLTGTSKRNRLERTGTLPE